MLGRHSPRDPDRRCLFVSGAKLSRCYDRGLDEVLKEAAGFDEPGGDGLVEISKRATTNPGKKVAKQ